MRGAGPVRHETPAQLFVNGEVNDPPTPAKTWPTSRHLHLIVATLWHLVHYRVVPLIALLTTISVRVGSSCSLKCKK